MNHHLISSSLDGLPYLTFHFLLFLLQLCRLFDLDVGCLSFSRLLVLVILIVGWSSLFSKWFTEVWTVEGDEHVAACSSKGT